jgi:diguanylate cyclase (GGDEF)-like protein
MQRKTKTEIPQNELERSEEIQRQIQALSSRDLQLWSIGLLVMLVLSAGFLALIFPNLAWRSEVKIDSHLLPQFFFGLIALITLFNLYVISQKRSLNATRRELIRELVFNERMEGMTMLDPTTQLLNRRGTDEILSKEVSRANRLGSSLTTLMVKLQSLDVVNGRYGVDTGDKLIIEAAKIVKSTFRGSDTVTRYSGTQFLVIMPDTSEEQAEYAIRRLQDAVDQWNVMTKTGWEINLGFGLASHVTGCDAEDLLRSAERKLMPKHKRLVPVFLPMSSPAGESSQILV